MNSYSEHVKITRDTLILATSPRELRWYASRDDEPRTEKHDEEYFHMSQRWNRFKFSHQYVGVARVENIPPYGKCFVRLVQSGAT